MTTSIDTEQSSQGGTPTLPPFKVILHNDGVNDARIVVRRVLEFTRLEAQEAIRKTTEAHDRGLSVLMVTHKEHAEMIQEQFDSCHPPIIVTIEADI